MEKNLKRIAVACYSGFSKSSPAEVARLKYREELKAEFVKILGCRPTEDICEFNLLSTGAMKRVIDLVLSGVKLENIKTFTIWKDHQTPKDGSR